MGNVRKFSQAHVRDVVEEFYLMRGLRVVTMSVDAPKRALEHMELHNLKPADALHLAIMEDLGETVIVSDDKDFDGIAGITRVPL